MCVLVIFLTGGFSLSSSVGRASRDHEGGRRETESPKGKKVGTHRFALRSEEEDAAAARAARAGSASGVAGSGAMSNHFRSRQPWKMRFIRSCGRVF